MNCREAGSGGGGGGRLGMKSFGTIIQMIDLSNS